MISAQTLPCLAKVHSLRARLFTSCLSLMLLTIPVSCTEEVEPEEDLHKKVTRLTEKQTELEAQKQLLESKNEQLMSRLDTLHQRLEELKPDGSENEDFDFFFGNFLADTVFQRSRVRFPVTEVYKILEAEGGAGGFDTQMVDEALWKHRQYAFDNRDMHGLPTQAIFDTFEPEKFSSNQRMVAWYQDGTCGYFRMRFEGFEGKWYLTMMENLGN